MQMEQFNASSLVIESVQPLQVICDSASKSAAAPTLLDAFFTLLGIVVHWKAISYVHVEKSIVTWHGCVNCFTWCTHSLSGVFNIRNRVDCIRKSSIIMLLKLESYM